MKKKKLLLLIGGLRVISTSETLEYPFGVSTYIDHVLYSLVAFYLLQKTENAI